MKNYQKGGSSGYRGDKGGRSSFKPEFKNKSEDRGSVRDTPMYKAVCSECHKGCDVPFRPSNDKPVYCRDCFSAKRDKETKEYHASIGRGTEGKKFSNDTPRVRTEVARHEHNVAPVIISDETKKQLAEISSKLDRLFTALEKITSAIPAQVDTTPSIAKKVVTSPVVTKKSVSKVTAKKVAVKKVAEVKKVAVKKTVAVKKVTAKKVTVKKTK